MNEYCLLTYTRRKYQIEKRLVHNRNNPNLVHNKWWKRAIQMKEKEKYIRTFIDSKHRERVELDKTTQIKITRKPAYCNLFI